MKAVIYARYSSNNQTEQSIEGQLRVCNNYAQSHGITVVGTYIDRALSGRTDRRPEFQRMIVDAERASWDIVLVYKFDRFARSMYDDSRYKKHLQDYGKQVVSASEHIPTGAEGKLAEGMLVVFNQYYSEELAIKTRRGMKESAYKCQVTGNPPFGYYNGKDKKYHINDLEAAAVREIYTRYAAGDKVQDIINWLTDHGYKTRLGKQFNKNTISNMIRNPRYKGTYIYDDIIIEGGMPAIIEVKTWETAQRRLEMAKSGTSRRKDVYMLTGKAYCGECHEPMNGESGVGRNGTLYRYYKCSGRKKGTGCTAETVQKDLLEQAVINHTRSLFGNDKTAYKIAAEVARQLQDLRDNNTAAKAAAKALEDTNKGINNILAAIEQGIFSASTKDRLDELENKKVQLEKTLEKESTKAPNLKAEDIQRIVKKLVKNSKSGQELIDIFVYRVFIYDDHCVITYLMPDFPPELVSYDDIQSILAGGSGSPAGKDGEPIMPETNRYRIVIYPWGFVSAFYFK